MDVKQKCSYHPELEAVGACVRCGAPVCRECKRELGIKIHCPECALKHFAEREGATTATRNPYGQRSAAYSQQSRETQHGSPYSVGSSDGTTEVRISNVLGGPPAFPLASRWARLGAAIIDGILTGVVVYGGFLLCLLVLELGIFSAFLVALALALGLFVVQCWFLSIDGQTIGKKPMNIRIVEVDTERNGGFVRNVVLRWIVNGLIASIPYVGGFYALVDILFIFRADKRCIHDFIAGTHVVKTS